MSDTTFYKPNQLDELLSLLEKYNEQAVMVNGGTDIVSKMTEKRISPEVIVYMQEVNELTTVQVSNNMISIGGAVTYKSVVKHELIKQYPGLITAIECVGSPPIRVVATPAGNLATAAPAPDCAVMLLALDAKVRIVSIAGERDVPLKNFFINTGETVLKSNEVIKEILIPESGESSYSGYARLARKKGQDIAKILVGVAYDLTEGKLTNVKIALGALSNTPIRANSLEQEVEGKTLPEAISLVKKIYPEEATRRLSRYKLLKERATPYIIARAFTNSKSVN